MKEFLESNDGIKMMAMEICGIQYQDEKYLVYSVLRGNGEMNIFVSKLLLTSTGYTCNSSFSNGEKEILEGVIEKMFSKVPVSFLLDDGFSLLKEVDLTDSLSFDKDICYVSTVSKKQLKDVLIFYQLVNEEILDNPVIEVHDDKKIFNKGSFVSILFILFGILVLVVSVYIVLSILIK